MSAHSLCCSILRMAARSSPALLLERCIIARACSAVAAELSFDSRGGGAGNLSRSLANANAGDASLLPDTDVACSDIQAEARVARRSLASTVPFRSFNLAPFLRSSATLQKLVALGVSLSEVEKFPKVAESLLKTADDTVLSGRIDFLRSLGLADIGRILSKGPSLIMEDLEDLRARVNYLKYRRFDDASIETIVSRCPDWLCENVADVDAALGRLQKEFSLSGDEVRTIVTKHPKLVLFDWRFVSAAKVELKEFLGFTKEHLKALLVTQPKIFTTAHYHLRKRFDYLHNTMGITHADIVTWPSILRARQHVVKERHLFLAALGRAQYDTSKPNYVSLKELVSLPLPEFCKRVAKADERLYNDFLKTL